MNWRHSLLLLVIVSVVACVFLFPAIPQDEAYHNFADKRALLGISNCLDVLSNALFLIVGTLGARFILSKSPEDRSTFGNPVERWAYLIFFLAVGATAFGSAYYHLRPSDSRLLWDRLPMAIGFLSLVAGVLCERTTPKNGLRYLILLPVWGTGTVYYWFVTQENGHGDLRPYVMAQFGSMLAIMLLVALFAPQYTRGGDLIISLGIYGLAKVFEYYDHLIFGWGGIVSGHTVKHLIAAVSAWWILRMLQLRTEVSHSTSSSYCAE
jgi:hypothetical protein